MKYQREAIGDNQIEPTLCRLLLVLVVDQVAEADVESGTLAIGFGDDLLLTQVTALHSPTYALQFFDRLFCYG